MKKMMMIATAFVAFAATESRADWLAVGYATTSPNNNGTRTLNCNGTTGKCASYKGTATVPARGQKITIYDANGKGSTYKIQSSVVADPIEDQPIPTYTNTHIDEVMAVADDGSGE